MKNEPLEVYKLELKDINSEKKEKKFRKINCPSCESEVPVKNLDLGSKLGKCEACNVVFSFEEDILELKAPQKAQQQIIRPEGIDIFSYDGELEFTMVQPMRGLEIFAFIFLPLIAAMLSIIFIAGKMSLMTASIMWLFGFILPWIYSRIRSKHKLHIIIDNSYLSLIRKPQKLLKDQHFPIQDIDQLYLKQLDGMVALMMIVNGLEGQKHVKLVQRISSLSKARYLEQEIEKHLKIQDRVVPEEM